MSLRYYRLFHSRNNKISSNRWSTLESRRPDFFKETSKGSRMTSGKSSSEVPIIPLLLEHNTNSCVLDPFKVEEVKSLSRAEREKEDAILRL
jgi:hypothetical protein